MVILDEQEKSQEQQIDIVKDDKDTTSSKQDIHMEQVIKTSIDVTKVTNLFTILSDKLHFHIYIKSIAVMSLLLSTDLKG